MKMYIVQFSLILFGIVQFAQCAAIMSMAEGMKYLEKFGYTDDKTMTEMTAKQQENAIMYFQKMNSLPMTGKFDKETTELMNKPRCGRSDHFRNNFINVLDGNDIWSKRNLTYKLMNFPRNGLDRQLVIQEIDRAFALWAEHVPLSFRRVWWGSADIEIRFNPFPKCRGDGPGVTLAYAYYPHAGGDICFDNENWTVGSTRGINLFTTAAHEIGHALGLVHSEVKGALMNEYSSPYNPNFRLHQDDISRIQRLYGRKSQCTLEKVDAIFSSPDNAMYAVKDDQVWKFKNNALMPEYPKSISEEWPQLPNSIDAAYTHEKNIYFMKGSTVWSFNGKMMKKREFTNLPNSNIDAAFTVDDSLCIISGSQYWMYDVLSAERLDLQEGFPRIINRKGIPLPVDAAYYDQMRYVHFFKDNQVYTLDRATGYEVATSQDICEFLTHSE